MPEIYSSTLSFLGLVGFSLIVVLSVQCYHLLSYEVLPFKKNIHGSFSRILLRSLDQLSKREKKRIRK